LSFSIHFRLDHRFKAWRVFPKPGVENLNFIVNAEARQISAGNVKKREFDIQPGDSLSFLPQKHLLAN
jgi:hypothetical protein